MILTLLLLGGIFNAPSQDFLKFATVDILDLEFYIAQTDKLFVLFFETLDGKTEEIHRQFLKSKEMLKYDKIDIEVVALHKKLSTRLQNLF